MNISELNNRDRVLVQSRADVREHATIVGFNPDGKVVLRLSDYKITAIEPQYILKVFKNE